MKSFNKLLILSSLCVLLVVSGCKKQNGLASGNTVLPLGGKSYTTGWSYNDPAQGFFNVQTEYYGKCPNGMILVDVATTVRGQNGDMVSAVKNNTKKRVAASAFFMDKYEITNLDWREYVRWLQMVYKHRPDIVVRALPDETVWRKELAYNEPYVREYYVSPAYNNYPVVGVSWVQATKYCKWRTDRLNELELIYAGIIPYVPLEIVNQKLQEYPDSAKNFVFETKTARDYVYFVNANYEDFESEEGEALKFQPDFKSFDLNGDGEIMPNEWSVVLEGVLYDSEVRLPTEMEWEYAAYGLVTEEGIYKQTNTYPWNGSQLRIIDDPAYEGLFKANFLRGRGDPIGVQANGTLTMPVGYFMPNDYGLYDMAGNVNEWVKDVYRANVTVVEEINSYRGNEFESDSLYAEDILNKHFTYLDPVMRDSMRTVLIAERGITKTGGDYRDFKDGDDQSALEDSTKVEQIYKDMTPIEKANAISNTARVYKGGGWNDRAIWLNPAQRRWLDERACRNDIGFRCVMSTVGGRDHEREQERDN